ncbi:MAG TPA: polysaccharide biosynthesis/export family protein [Longimicrobium sp.]|nr:polysaccharide biosynthesis/export family protein [Longimicrobium sp.]
MLRRLLLALACAAALLPSALPAQDASASLRPGDAVRLVVWRQPELSGEFPVSPEGTIQHPLLNEVRVVGASRAEIRDRLRAVLARYEREPSFVFDFLYRVAVGGEVRLPNLYTLSPETTVGQAVAAAGGVTEFGRLDNVRLIRGGQETRINLKRADPEVAEMRIRSGDQIRVMRRANILRDYVGPAASLIAAGAALISVFDNN